MGNMNITSAKYVQREGVNETILATIDGKTMSVPLDPENRHFAEIQKQVASGDLTIQEAD
tara:strand:+ start:2288 stop:2467 length:180 start_codon:yes stop_codon:yes gene_type:complete